MIFRFEEGNLEYYRQEPEIDELERLDMARELVAELEPILL